MEENFQDQSPDQDPGPNLVVDFLIAGAVFFLAAGVVLPAIILVLMHILTFLGV